MNDGGPACAHVKVVLKHHDYPGGTRSDYWECADGCGKRFWPDTFDPTIRNLRAHLAGQALNGMLANPELGGMNGPSADSLAPWSVQYADALIAALEAKPAALSLAKQHGNLPSDIEANLRQTIPDKGARLSFVVCDSCGRHSGPEDLGRKCLLTQPSGLACLGRFTKPPPLAA